MSHLNYRVCGTDFFISYNKCSSSVSKLVESLKILFARNQITYFSNDVIEFNSNYLHNTLVQIARAKIFLFIIDKFGLECEWFLYNFITAHLHSQKHHLPILIPIVFDNELSDKQASGCVDLDHQELLKKDLNKKRQLVNTLISQCKVVIRMSEMDSFQRLVRHLKDIVVDIIPFNDNLTDPRFYGEKRFVDSKRPLNSEEERFFKEMCSTEFNLMNEFEISRVNIRSILPRERVYVALSVPYVELSLHLTTMINVQCHLVWMDVARVNNENYFNFLWMNNDDEYEVARLKRRGKLVSKEELITFQAHPPSFMIFYDLNPAQLEHLYQEYTNDERNWNLELIDSYVYQPQSTAPTAAAVAAVAASANSRRSKSAARRGGNNFKSSSKLITSSTLEFNNNKHQQTTQTSNDEIYYICQFRNNYTNANTDNKKNKSNNNKLKHSIIDTRFKQTYLNMVKTNYEQMFVPIKVRPLLVQVNTITNRHLYFTGIFKPIAHYKLDDDELEDLNTLNRNQMQPGCQHIDRAFNLDTSEYIIRMGLTDLELLDAYNEYKTWSEYQLTDLKAYKDEKQISRFLTIWTRTQSNESFYEGITQLLVGLNKHELLLKINETSKKGLYPRLLTNYGYLNAKGEHVYAVFLCQF